MSIVPETRGSSPEAGRDPGRAAFWVNSWRTAARRSVLRASQKSSPASWQAFYAAVAGVYARVTTARDIGRTAAAELFARGVLGPGMAVVDLGCGPGTLAIPMAACGALVTAVDPCRAMLATLAQEAERAGVTGISTVEGLLECYRPDAFPALTVASCVPEAVTPSGLLRLEALTGRTAAVVLGVGGDALPLRRSLWRALMHAPLPAPVSHLLHAVGYLTARGRHVSVAQMRVPCLVEAPIEDFCLFYDTYFAIFGHQGSQVEKRIRKELARFAVNGRISLSGTSRVAVIWWEPPERRDTEPRRVA